GFDRRESAMHALEAMIDQAMPILTETEPSDAETAERVDRLIKHYWRSHWQDAAFRSYREAMAVYPSWKDELDKPPAWRAPAKTPSLPTAADGPLHDKARIVVEAAEGVARLLADRELTPAEKAERDAAAEIAKR